MHAPTAPGRSYPSRPVARIARAALQSLEGRRMFASMALTNGELVVTGDAAKSNSINVSLSVDKKTYTAAIGATKQTFAATSVHGLRLNGGGLADTITVGSTITLDTVIQPGGGNDTVNGGAGSDNVFDSSGANTFTLNGGDDYVSGGTGGDTVNGGDGNDLAFLRGGDDRFTGGNGNDLIDGGDGTDTADGGSGSDVSLNTENRTTIEFHPGLGNSGVPAAAKSVLANGTLTVTGLAGGANVINVSASGNSLIVAAGATRNAFAKGSVNKIVVTGGGAADFINVDASLAVPSSINGGGGNDTIFGAGGNDTIVAGGGDDRLYTQGGNDSILGGDGNDTVESGSGNDTITGDSGVDVVDSGAGVDSGSGIEFAVNLESSAIPIPPTLPTVPTIPSTPAIPTNPSIPSTPSNSSAAKPSPRITAMRTTIMAGEALFVNGLSSSYGTGGQDTAHFEWDFGDSGGSYNKLVGFNAGHVYDRAGTYTVTLRLWNEKLGMASTSMTVNVTGSSRSAIYVSGSGSDGNSGSSSGSAIKSWARAMELSKGKSNVDILFRGGDTFGVTKEFNVNGDNVRMSSYGGGKATIKYTGPRARFDMVRVNRDSTGTTIDNLSFDSIFTGPDPSRSGMPHAISLLGTGTTVRNVSFYNLGYDINCNNEPNGVMVQNCESPTKFGLRSYLVWAQGSDFVIVGNKVANSTNEHPIRVFGVDRLLIAYNDLTNPQAYGFETSKTALNVQKGSDVTIYGNHIRGPRMQIGPLGGADGVNDKGARLTDVVLENNTFDDTIVQMYTGAQNVYFRNNVWNYKNADAIELEGYSSQYGRGIVNVNVVNNTFVNGGTQGKVIDLEGSVNGIKLENNLYKATNLVMGSKGTAAVYAVDMSAFRSFTSISNNIWAVPSSYPSWLSSHTSGKVFALIGKDQADTNNYYNIDKWNALSQVGTDAEENVSLSGSYTPTSSQSTVAGGIRNYPGVFGDYEGDSRPANGAWSIGAVQV